ncbi:hypothetical protein [Autumnicola edwardsiae]|uniref:Uncharacterized protein n=1 Tax=Autumnicola edwardsiae TaxID=3075594 RepID=A0ABU3CZJ3_9FLAO|nr:hypothetical protein [Zunongwangia sp. F297]MDT0651310.1 hypothetical protein [Zunongwangia sp. F297]
MSENSNKIHIDTDRILKGFTEDQEIDNENYLINYHSLITENIRLNNRKITRNSFWMITLLTIYFLVFLEGAEVLNIESVGGIKDPKILLNFLPVIFSFLYLQNITLWNNNINLIPLFEKVSRKMFSLGACTDTVNIIKPFSLLHHILNYQYENKKVNKILKIPVGIAFYAILFLPIVLDIFFLVLIYNNNNMGVIPAVCFLIVTLLTITTIVQALNSHKG